MVFNYTTPFDHNSHDCIAKEIVINEGGNKFRITMKDGKPDVKQIQACLGPCQFVRFE